jgi:hypothetical protein
MCLPCVQGLVCSLVHVPDILTEPNFLQSVMESGGLGST